MLPNDALAAAGNIIIISIGCLVYFDERQLARRLRSGRWGNPRLSTRRTPSPTRNGDHTCLQRQHQHRRHDRAAVPQCNAGAARPDARVRSTPASRSRPPRTMVRLTPSRRTSAARWPAMPSVIDSLNRGSSAIDVALSAGQSISDLLIQMKTEGACRGRRFARYGEPRGPERGLHRSSRSDHHDRQERRLQRLQPGRRFDQPDHSSGFGRRLAPHHHGGPEYEPVGRDRDDRDRRQRFRPRPRPRR